MAQGAGARQKKGYTGGTGNTVPHGSTAVPRLSSKSSTAAAELNRRAASDALRVRVSPEPWGALALNTLPAALPTELALEHQVPSGTATNCAVHGMRTSSCKQHHLTAAQ
jgi:hypothetical protein